ncbi:MAG: UDP-N-acetylmuramyl-tripeptide synthetase [Oligoflexia bacterium]|nr:UDP-N-acetylmuramyl-tripeptide synthetase [Oligoflexia bacterium]
MPHLNTNKQTEHSVLKILSDLLSDANANCFDFAFSSLEWRMEHAKSGDTLFYYLRSDEESWNKFKSRYLGMAKGVAVVINDLPLQESAVIKQQVATFTGVIVLKEEGFLEGQRRLAQRCYPINWDNKKLIGVTGTNGKTTVTFLCKQIAKMVGKRAACLGTLGVSKHNDDAFTPTESGLTTPPLLELYKILYQMLEQEGHDCCFMEVSSHSLALQRVYGLYFDVVAWTSFGQDHLDFHQDMDDYFQTKLQIVHYLREKGGRVLLLPTEEEELFQKIKSHQLTNGDAKVTVNVHKCEKYFSREQFWQLPLPPFLLTAFNQRNLELALAINALLWGDLRVDPLKLVPAPGRLSTYIFGEKVVIIDFAHTPDALEKTCLAIKEIYPKRELHLLFGCGGDRDRSKRPIMGEIASKVADKIYITSDNPRTEAPQGIISEIKSGVTKAYESMVDRKSAIVHAYNKMGGHAVLLIAGKGHEDYQIIGKVKYPYSDYQALLQARRKEIEMETEMEMKMKMKKRVSTDSRTYQAPEVFIALDGERFKGVDFIKDVLEKGCRFVVYAGSDDDEKIEKLQQQYPDSIFVKTEDTLLYLQELAKEHAKQWLSNGKQLIGITGSNGKTTNKQMLAHFLQEVLGDKLLATDKNFNNHIGVPKTLLMLEEHHEMAVVEMGSNHPGEIKLLCDIAMPTAGMITNVGDSHLEFFKSRDGVFQEKRTLFDSVMKRSGGKGVFVIPGDDVFLARLLATGEEVIAFSFAAGSGDHNVVCEYTASPSKLLLKIPPKVQTKLRLSSEVVEFSNLKIIGKHNFSNLAATFLLALSLLGGGEKVKGRLVRASENFHPMSNRSSWICGRESGKSFFLDAYNANPSSMRAAIEAVVEYYLINQVSEGEQLFILGDMNELGDAAASLHKEIGQRLAELGAGRVVFIGRYSSSYQEGYHEGKRFKKCASFQSVVCQTKDEFVNTHWAQMKSKFSYFFIKGSRSLALETLISDEI